MSRAHGGELLAELLAPGEVRLGDVGGEADDDLEVTLMGMDAEAVPEELVEVEALGPGKGDTRAFDGRDAGRGEGADGVSEAVEGEEVPIPVDVRKVVGVDDSVLGLAVGLAVDEAEFGAFGGDLQFAAEGAFNYLDLATGFGSRMLDGSYTLAPLSGGTARVEERRAETNVSYSRKLSDQWSLQSSLGVEYSELSQQGAGGLTREFVRPKGFVALVWKADETLDISLKGERKVELRRPSRRKATQSRTTTVAHSELSVADEALFQRLRSWRSDTAKEQAVPAYVILHDRTLRELSEVRPTSHGMLAGITGMGSAKIEHYGAELLALIGEFA